MKSDDFKVCCGYSSYEVSLNGSVREVRSKKTVKTYTFDDGTIYVVLKKGKHYRKIKVAELIALTYLEHKEYDVLVCLNGNWNDYSISNYKWVNPRLQAENFTKIWKPIEGTQGNYEVSEDGKIREFDSCRILKTVVINGKAYVNYYKYGYLCTKQVAQIVADAFIPRTYPSKIVGHKDGDPFNNKASNLVLDKRDIPFRNEKVKLKYKPVDEYTAGGEYVKTWESLTAASKGSGVNMTSIWRACNGKQQFAGGKVWRWKGNPFDHYTFPSKIQLQPWEYTIPIVGSVAVVSNFGRILDTRTGKEYRMNKDKTVSITVNGVSRRRKAYLWIADTLLPNPAKRHRLEFIDGNIDNWELTNLNWK